MKINESDLIFILIKSHVHNVNTFETTPIKTDGFSWNCVL